MLGKTNALGGMSPLRNVTVVGGKMKPENPLPRTIWIDTDIPIMDYLVSATSSTSSDITPYEGLVLITAQNSGSVSWEDIRVDVNLGRYRTIVFTLSFTYIYHSNKWINVAAWYFNGENWTEFSKISEKLLNIYDSTIDKTIFGTTKNITYASSKINNEYGIKVTNSSKTIDSIVQFNTPIDFNLYRTLHIKLLHSGSSTTFTFGIASALSDVAVSTTDIFDMAKLDATVAAGGSGEFDLDVSALTGIGYVGFEVGKNTYKTLQVVEARA